MSSVVVFSDLSPRGGHFSQSTPLLLGTNFVGEAIAFLCEFPELL